MGNVGTRLGLSLTLGVLALAVSAPGALALNCGGKGQPVCSETAPPGIVLPVPAGANPHGLTPLSTPPSPSTQLWSSVRGHKPYGFHAVSANRNGTTYDDEAYLGRQIGGSIARMGVDWGGIQYYPNTGAGGRPWYYEAYTDDRYLASIKAGLRPILVITRTPRRFTKVYNTSAGTNAGGCGTTDACWNPPRPAEAGRIAVFAADLVKRYPLAGGVELWNEPNLSNPFWGLETPNPEYYASLLKSVHDAVKRVNPNMPVIGGALTGSATDGTQNGYPVLSVRTFFRRMLAAGAQPNIDAISYHPYLGKYPTAGNPSSYLLGKITNGQTQIKNAYADAGKPLNERIVLSETGASTTDGWSPQQQSDWLSYQYYLMDTSSSTLPLASRTDAMLLHEPVEYPNPPFGNTWQGGYGLTKVKNASGFATKPAFCAFRTLWGGYSNCPAYIDPPG